MNNFVDECNEYYYAVVDGTLFQFESEEAYLDYIEWYIAQSKATFSTRELHAKKENPYTLSIPKFYLKVNIGGN